MIARTTKKQKSLINIQFLFANVYKRVNDRHYCTGTEPYYAFQRADSLKDAVK